MYTTSKGCSEKSTMKKSHGCAVFVSPCVRREVQLVVTLLDSVMGLFGIHLKHCRSVLEHWDAWAPLGVAESVKKRYRIEQMSKVFRKSMRPPPWVQAEFHKSIEQVSIENRRSMSLPHQVPSIKQMSSTCVCFANC